MAAGKEYQLKTVLSLRDRLSKPLAGIRKEFQKLDKSVKHVGQEAGRLGSMLGKPLAMLTGGGLVGLGAMVHTFSDLGDAIDKAAQRAGVGTTELQKLQYAAGLGGSSAEEMEHALIKLGQQMNAAAAGSGKEFAALMQHLGIPLKDANGKMRSSADIMRNLAEAMKNNKDQAARLQIATLAFGKSGAGLIPVLSGGASSLDEMGKRAEKLGLILDEKTIQASAAFNDQLGELKQLGKVASARIGGALAPAFEKLIPILEDIIRNNEEIIGQKLKEMVDEFAGALEKIDWNAVVEGIGETIGEIGRLLDMVGGAKGILMGFGILMGVDIASKCLSLAGAFAGVGKALFGLSKAMFMFSVSNPVTAAIMGIVGAITLFLTYKDDILGFLKMLWDKITNVAGSFWDLITGRGGSRGDAPRLNGDAAAMAAGGSSNSLDVTVAAERGTSARVTRTASSGGNMTVAYGPGGD